MFDISLAALKGLRLVFAESLSAREFPTPLQLTSLEADIYPNLCYGQDNDEIAQKMALPRSTVAFRVANIRRKLGVGRMGVALRFLDEFGMSDWLPPDTYKEAAQKMALLTPAQLQIVAELTKQWRLHLSGHIKKPTRTTIGNSIWYAPQTIAQSLCVIALVLGVSSQYEARECKMVRWFEMTNTYERLFVNTGAT